MARVVRVDELLLAFGYSVDITGTKTVLHELLQECRVSSVEVLLDTLGHCVTGFKTHSSWKKVKKVMLLGNVCCDCVH